MNNYIFPFLWMRGEKEEIIREEIEKIAECGIGAVCVEARPHDDFCGVGWWRDLDVVIDEARKRNMKVWILDDKHFPTGYANGLLEKKYPERKKQYIACTTADIFGSGHALTLHIKRMLKPTIGFWEIGQPADYEERENNSLVAIVAARFTGSDAFSEEVIDLTNTYDGNFAAFTLPEGQWRIHVIYKTRTDGGDENYINMIDPVSAYTQIEAVYEPHYDHYASEFGKTIAGFFSDEPQFGNIKEQCFDTKLGKRKMPLPWSDDLEKMLLERYGETYKKYLPFLFIETEIKKLQPQMRYDYLDCISKLYEANFCRPIGLWCKDHGVEYIGHVVEDNSVHSRLGLGAGHWFRAMAGQDMSGIDVIGGQIIFGAPSQIRKRVLDNDGEFYHYALGKLGASLGHLDPKKKGRTMCELFGAYGWKFGVRDMKYLLDHLLCKGINYLVPHAFSMADYPDFDCPPHFYARGNNPQYPWFAELMKYGNRMCDLLNNGRHVASVAVLYDGEADWAGEHMPMQKICRELIENQIEFDIVCLDMLEDLSAYNGRVENDKLIINDVVFHALLIPQAEYVPEKLKNFINKYINFPSYYVGDGEENNVNLKLLADMLRKQGFCMVSVESKFPELSVYHYEKNRQIFMFFNESSYKVFKGKVCVPSTEPMIFYDGFLDTYTKAQTEIFYGNSIVYLELEPGESCILMEQKELSCEKMHQFRGSWIAKCSQEIDISSNWNVSWTKSRNYPEFEKTKYMDALCPLSDIESSFSGVIRYEKEVRLKSVPQTVYFTAEHVYEVMRVFVNNTLAGYCLTPPYRLEIGNLLKIGDNKLVIEVATTPDRDQLNYTMPPFDFFHEAMEPTGMFGKISMAGNNLEETKNVSVIK